jgi:hypothetical protein
MGLINPGSLMSGLLVGFRATHARREKNPSKKRREEINTEFPPISLSS